jgi:hypothetical protein
MALVPGYVRRSHDLCVALGRRAHVPLQRRPPPTRLRAQRRGGRDQASRPVTPVCALRVRSPWTLRPSRAGGPVPQRRELDSYWHFIAGSINRLLACLDGLESSDLNWRPLDNASSLYVLGTHILGSTEENVLGVLCRQRVQRDRDAEFAAMGDSAEPLRRRWCELHQRVDQALGQLTPKELDEEREHPRRGQLTGWEVLMVAARNAAEHMGHAELTR